MIELRMMDREEIRTAQALVTEHHYLHKPVDSRCSVEGMEVLVSRLPVGVLLFGRPEATRCDTWYGGVEDVQAGRCEVTRWQVLNLARVWLDPKVQRYGVAYDAGKLPGFVDRKGVFRSTLASTVLRMAMKVIGHQYLLRRPPVFLDEPYEIRYLLSYCDTALHRGTIYKAAGFDLYRTNARGIQTWRVRLPELTDAQHDAIRAASKVDARAQRYRAKRAQLELGL